MQELSEFLSLGWIERVVKEGVMARMGVPACMLAGMICVLWFLVPFVSSSHDLSLTDPFRIRPTESASVKLVTGEDSTTHSLAQAPGSTSTRPRAGTNLSEDFFQHTLTRPEEAEASARPLPPIHHFSPEQIGKASWLDVYTQAQPRFVFRNGEMAGIQVQHVAADSLLEEAGLRAGDIIVSINENPLNNPLSALAVMGQAAFSIEPRFEIERAGRRHPLTIKVDFDGQQRGLLDGLNLEHRDQAYRLAQVGESLEKEDVATVSRALQRDRGNAADAARQFLGSLSDDSEGNPGAVWLAYMADQIVSTWQASLDS